MARLYTVFNTRAIHTDLPHFSLIILAAMDSLLGKVPIVDLEAANDGDGSHKNALCRALGEVGFAYIKNHGIPETKIREAFEWVGPPKGNF